MSSPLKPISQMNRNLVGSILERYRKCSTPNLKMSHVKNCWSCILCVRGIDFVSPRKSDITNMILRAMIAGNAACFLTGSIAGKILDKH
jgi:hypothetical protein